MTVIPTQRINPDAVDFTQFEFFIQCEKPNHTGDEPAEWIIWYKPKRLCGCPLSKFVYWCAPCYERRTKVDVVVCSVCNRKDSRGPWANIIRTERL